MAKVLSARGASKGGKARANVLTPEQRKDIARQAVRARWVKAGKLKQEVKPSPPSPVEEDSANPPARPYSMFPGKVKIGHMELECHVLSDHKRVFTQNEMVRALSGVRERGHLLTYLQRNPLTADLAGLAPIEFDVPVGKNFTNKGHGYEATLLIEICDKYLEAREKDMLHPNQLGLAKQAEIIMRATAKVGIIALIDEATGYQRFREKHALQLKLQAFIAEEIQEWARTFPEEFWLQLARLEGIHYNRRFRPLRWGKYVMMFVYDAIDKDVGNELRKKNPNPRFLSNHHQWLLKFGRDKVIIQIEKVITIMKLCKDMEDFKQKFDHVFGKAPHQMSLDDFLVDVSR